MAHFKPRSSGDGHAGTIDVQMLSAYALYGLSETVDILMKVPFVSWHMDADEEDNHHRTETIQGFGDIDLGVRWAILNQKFGPGHRLFVGMNISLPTAGDYDINPFSSMADSVKHTHFALGGGHYSSSLNVEWWYRSEFPLIIGISSNYAFPLNTSTIGFKSSKKLSLHLQAIMQQPLFAHAFPYFKIKIRKEFSDYWEGKNVPNSGGIFIDATVALSWEISESVSLIPSVDFPLWQAVQGSQLTGYAAAISLRRIF